MFTGYFLHRWKDFFASEGGPGAPAWCFSSRAPYT